jgi:hypothetical protein
MKKFELSTSGAEHPIESLSILVGEDLLTCLWGGTKPHIGAVALALPRPSLADQNTTSSTASVLTMLGHKEDGLVKAVAEKLSARLNKNVVVTAGIHWDNLDENAIREIEENCAFLADMIVEAAEGEK